MTTKGDDSPAPLLVPDDTLTRGLLADTLNVGLLADTLMWGLLAATAQRRKFWLRVVSTHAQGGGTHWWGGKSSCLLGFL